MTDVESVNPETPVIPDSEGSDDAWVDPLHSEMNPDRMSDELDAPSTEPAAEIADNEPSVEQLQAVAGEDDEAETPAEGEGEGAEPKPEAAEDGESGDDPDEGEEPPADDPAKRPRRRSRSRTERRALQRRNAELEGENRAYREMIQSGRLVAPEAAEEANTEEPETEEVSAEAPELADYDYDQEAWAKALGEWTDAKIQSVKDEAAQAQATEEETAEQTRRDEAAARFGGLQEAARDKYDDYDAVVYDPTTIIPQNVAGLIVESEVGAELAYYLATHQDEAVQMAGMSEAQVARAIGRIEARLEAAEATDPDPEPEDNAAGEDGEENAAEEAEAAAEEAPESEPAPQQRHTPTRAPEPIGDAVVNGTSDFAGSTNRQIGKMDMDEYAAARRSGKIK